MMNCLIDRVYWLGLDKSEWPIPDRIKYVKLKETIGQVVLLQQKKIIFIISVTYPDSWGPYVSFLDLFLINKEKYKTQVNNNLFSVNDSVCPKRNHLLRKLENFLGRNLFSIKTFQNLIQFWMLKVSEISGPKIPIF